MSVQYQLDQFITEGWTFEISGFSVLLVSECKAFRMKFYPLDDNGHVLNWCNREADDRSKNGLITAKWLHQALTRAIDNATN